MVGENLPRNYLPLKIEEAGYKYSAVGR